ncbi:MAG: hypothetical protein OEM81_07975 [Acidimicrobiia bacterium]|nr:hypothetical protein [Acidimicrobiia bacterium]MDH3397752.1 hypothetical protein [Acidimicrobiia bacterium]
MTYERPEVRDFGSVAEHTYGGRWQGEFSGCSGKYEGDDEEPLW